MVAVKKLSYDHGNKFVDYAKRKNKNKLRKTLDTDDIDDINDNHDMYLHGIKNTMTKRIQEVQLSRH